MTPPLMLAALAGMIVFLSPFELLRSYALTSARARLLLLARLGRYTGLAWMCLPLLDGDMLAPTRIGHGLSLAYGLALAMLALLLAWRERRAV